MCKELFLAFFKLHSLLFELLPLFPGVRSRSHRHDSAVQTSLAGKNIFQRGYCLSCFRYTRSERVLFFFSYVVIIVFEDFPADLSRLFSCRRLCDVFSLGSAARLISRPRIDPSFFKDPVLNDLVHISEMRLYHSSRSPAGVKNIRERTSHLIEPSVHDLTV